MGFKRVCPVCGKGYTGHPAISRKDNATEICPDCGTMEALKDAGLIAEPFGNGAYSRVQRGVKIMRRVKIAEHVKSGETVWNGYVGGETTCTAPDDPGLYTLFELAYENTNTHAGWEWFKEEKVVANDESGLPD